MSKRTQEKLDHLAGDFPELHERVKAGELSVNAAAMEAGIVAQRKDLGTTLYRGPGFKVTVAP